MLSDNLKTVMRIYISDPRRESIGGVSTTPQLLAYMDTKTDEEAMVILQAYANRKISNINAQISGLTSERAILQAIL